MYPYKNSILGLYSLWSCSRTTQAGILCFQTAHFFDLISPSAQKLCPWISVVYRSNRLISINMPSPVKMVAPGTSSSRLRIVKLSDKARIPTKGSPFSAGYDLYSAAEIVVPAMGHAVVPTDLRIAVPDGTYGRVAPRSGLAVKHHIDVGAGVVDADYRGPVGVVLFNHGQKEFVVQEGDRVAQLICEKIAYPELEEVQTLTETERGEGGFGSTGHK